MKRVGIFFFYDADGIVDDYVTYFLKEANASFSHILVVCKGKILPESLEKLRSVSNQVLIQESKGFDCGAYKDGISLLGEDFLANYEELVLFDYTNFGPLYPLSEMFAVMEQKDIDFWTITNHSERQINPFKLAPRGYESEHVHARWIAIRKKMFSSEEFNEYWGKFLFNDQDIFILHEDVFTKYFNERGFSSDIYLNIDDLNELTEYPLFFSPLDLLKRRCPIVKRGIFSHDYKKKAYFWTGKETLDAFEYIRKFLEYDVDLMWKNLLRVSHQADLYYNLYLNYVIPSSMKVAKEEASNKGKVSLICHSYFEDLFDECFGYIEAMPKGSDIFITTNTEAKKDYILDKVKEVTDYNVEVILIENRGRDVSALLVPFKEKLYDYDYVCFIHDKKTAYVKPQIIGRNFFEKCTQNLLLNRDYVYNILTLFRENPCLGILSPSIPNFAMGHEWSVNFRNTKKLARKLGIKVSMSPKKIPIAPLGTMFWFRPRALKTLIDYNWEYCDFPAEPNENDGTLLHAIERVYPFVAQHEGFFSAYIVSDYFAQTELVNKSYMIEEAMEFMEKNSKKTTSFFDQFYHLEKRLNKSRKYRFFTRDYWKRKKRKILG